MSTSATATTLITSVLATASSTSSVLSSATGTQTPDAPHSNEHTLSPGAIAGIVLGGVSLLILCIGLLIFPHHRKRNDADLFRLPVVSEVQTKSAASSLSQKKAVKQTETQQKSETRSKSKSKKNKTKKKKPDLESGEEADKDSTRPRADSVLNGDADANDNKDDKAKDVS